MQSRVNRRRQRIACLVICWRRVEIDGAQRLVSRAANLVRLAMLDHEQAAALQRLPHAIDDRKSGTRNHVHPLIGAGMPYWSTDEILAVHFRMHKAEGELFRKVLVESAAAIELKVTTLPHKSPFDAAVTTLGITRPQLDALVTALGKQAGPPWGQHQKEAAVAAIVALQG